MGRKEPPGSRDTRPLGIDTTDPSWLRHPSASSILDAGLTARYNPSHCDEARRAQEEMGRFA